jgi:hypothetical protein
MFLFGVNRLNGAYINAGAAICADFRVDYIDIAFGDTFNGAFRNTSTTGGTSVIYFVSHNILHFVSCPVLIYSEDTICQEVLRKNIETFIKI